jgi:hypothetical protein
MFFSIPEETNCFEREANSMKYSDSIKPGLWGAVLGAIAMIVLGFWGMGWKTAGAADEAARMRADAAVVGALVPYCVAKAEQDGDATKLAKLRAEGSEYSRAQIVAEAGWATVLGASTPDRALAEACSTKLRPA